MHYGDKSNQIEVLAEWVLPSEILKYFSIVSVESNSTEIHIHLDELINPELVNDNHFESKGFMESVSVTDFPIHDHKVILMIRRRCWTDIRTGIPINLDVVCKGTRYSKEFGLFLKKRMETSPVTCHTLEEYYHIDGHTFESLQLNGRKSKKKGLRFYVTNIRTLNHITFIKNDFFQKHHKDAARLSMAKWYNKVDESGIKSFNVIASTFYEH